MEVRELTDQDHDVLGAEYCSGYTDIFGKWNTGFYCPNLGNGETVYCCGTVTYKYCCTRRDQQSSTGFSQAVILGSALGSVLVFVLVTMVSCLVCRRCVLYRRGHPSLSGGPLYSMHCSSTASGVANMYSFSGQTTAATTPLDANGDPHQVLLDLEATSTPHRDFAAQHRAFGLLPSDPPPPYNDAGSPDAVHLRDPSIISNSTTSFTAHLPTGHHHHHQTAASTSNSQHQQHEESVRNLISTQRNLYWSTKF